MAARRALSAGGIGGGLARAAALIVGGMVLAVTLAEAAVRIVQPVPPDELLPRTYDHGALRRIIEGDAYLRFDRELGWSPAPSVSRGDDVRFETNSAGFRAEREFAPVPPEGVARLAAFGDSFTHCDEVEYPNCWTARLEQTLPRAEVLNFGVPGYGPDQAWLRYRRDGRPFHPCGVIIGYLVENINRVVNRFRPFYAPEDGIALSKPRFLLEGADGLRLLPNPAETPEVLDDPRWVESELGPHDYWYFPWTFTASPFDVLKTAQLARSGLYREQRRRDLRSDERLPYARAYRTQGEAFQVAGRVLIHFARDVQHDGATPVVVIFAGRRDLAAILAGDTVYQPLVDWLVREGIPTLDLGEALLRGRSPSRVNELFAEGGHFDRSGNRAAAAILARELPPLVAPTCGRGYRLRGPEPVAGKAASGFGFHVDLDS